MAVETYTIGLKRLSEYDNYGVEYHPNFESYGRMITVWEGTLGGNGKSGATLSPQELLKRVREGKAFRRYFEITDCEWFIPYIQRMAEGNDVSIEEIKKAYREKNEGVDLPCAK